MKTRWFVCPFSFVTLQPKNAYGSVQTILFFLAKISPICNPKKSSRTFTKEFVKYNHFLLTHTMTSVGQARQHSNIPLSNQYEGKDMYM